MPDNGRPMGATRRWTAVLVALSVLAAACSSGGGGGNGAAPTSTDRSASGDEDVGAGDAVPGEGEEGVLGADDPAANEEPSGVDASKPVRRTDVPAEGTYRYDYRETGSEAKERIIQYVDLNSGAGWVRQLRSYATQSVASRSLEVWLADQLYQEVEQRARADQVAAACVWDPGFTLLRLPLEVGATWSSESQCDTDAATKRQTLEARVTGVREEEVGSATVETFVIEQTVVTTTDVTAALTPTVTVETRTTTDLYSVDRKVLVESAGVRTATLNGAPQGVPQNFSLRLRSPEPDPFER